MRNLKEKTLQKQNSSSKSQPDVAFPKTGSSVYGPAPESREEFRDNVKSDANVYPASFLWQRPDEVFALPVLIG